MIQLLEKLTENTPENLRTQRLQARKFKVDLKSKIPKKGTGKEVNSTND